MGYFLPSSALPGLKKYKYSSVDHSLISKYILKPFYAGFILLFPKWVAPNLVTLSGLGFVIVNLACALYYNPTFDQECPSWVYLSYAAGLFLYQTFDACDGLQARRTGQSGPLGELFDHCVDALNTTLELLVFASAVNLGYGWEFVLSQFATLANFYLSTWEEYHTETLYLSVFSGPVEGILMVVTMYIVTAIKGPQFWHENILEQVTVPEVLAEYAPKSVTAIDLYFLFAAIGLAFNIFAASRNVLEARLQKKQPLLPALFQLVPLGFFFVTLAGWIHLSPEILYKHLLPLSIATGIASAFTVGRIITAHVTKQEFPMWNPLLLLPAVGITAHLTGSWMGYDPIITGVATVWAGLGLSLGIYGSFIAEIIYEITTYLDIGCLYIKHPIDAKKAK